MIGYKVLGWDHTSLYVQHDIWFVPSGKRPGRWMPKKVGIKLCVRGYHFCRHEYDLLEWFGPAIWRVEVRGEIIEGKDKAVAEQARLLERVERWNARTARLFAADCAERQFGYLPDRVRMVCENVIEVVRQFVHGNRSAEDLARASISAFRMSDRRNLSPAAMRAVSSVGYSSTSVGDYSEFTAARDAAHCARDAAYAAYDGAPRLDETTTAAESYRLEREWQAERLKEYLDGKRG
jgi:hypothetical protein